MPASTSVDPVQTSEVALLRGPFYDELARRDEQIRLLARQNEELSQALEEMKVRLAALKSDMELMRGGVHPFARNLSAMVERAITLHGLISQKRSQVAHLQMQVESTLKDNKPMWPPFIRCSNSINSIYRLFKRIRKQGKIFTAQRQLNDVTFEAIGTLTHLAGVICDHRSDTCVSPPGLESYAVEKVNVDLPNLMELLRIRLS